MLIAIPLLLIPVVLYNIVVLFGADGNGGMSQAIQRGAIIPGVEPGDHGLATGRIGLAASLAERARRAPQCLAGPTAADVVAMRFARGFPKGWTHRWGSAMRAGPA